MFLGGKISFSKEGGRCEIWLLNKNIDPCLISRYTYVTTYRHRGSPVVAARYFLMVNYF